MRQSSGSTRSRRPQAAHFMARTTPVAPNAITGRPELRSSLLEKTHLQLTFLVYTTHCFRSATAAGSWIHWQSGEIEGNRHVHLLRTRGAIGTRQDHRDGSVVRARGYARCCHG